MTNTLTKYPSVYWEKFFNKFSQMETLPTNEWEVAHILAYFAKRYKNYYGIDYTFNLSKPPSKSYDVYRIKSLGNMLSTDPVIVKDYIDFVFDKVLPRKKGKITSIAVFVDVKLINDYKPRLMVDKNKSVDRTTEIPPNFLSILAKHKFDFIKTYGQLAFLNKQDNKSLVFQELKTAGFDIEVLDRVK